MPPTISTGFQCPANITVYQENYHWSCQFHRTELGFIMFYQPLSLFHQDMYIAKRAMNVSIFCRLHSLLRRNYFLAVTLSCHTVTLHSKGSRNGCYSPFSSYSGPTLQLYPCFRSPFFLWAGKTVQPVKDFHARMSTWVQFFRTQVT